MQQRQSVSQRVNISIRVDINYGSAHLRLFMSCRLYDRSTQFVYRAIPPTTWPTQ